jgi:hypothetical protein
MGTLRAIARSATRWALVGLVSVAPAGRGHAQAGIEFFRSAAGTPGPHPIVLPDAELERLRGRQLPSPAQPAKAPRKRVVLWDEARTATNPYLLDPHNSVSVVTRGAAGVSNLHPVTIR